MIVTLVTARKHLGLYPSTLRVTLLQVPLSVQHATHNLGVSTIALLSVANTLELKTTLVQVVQ